MEPYIPQKHLTTPQRKHIIDLDSMQHTSIQEIHQSTLVPTTTIRRTLRSGAVRHNKNPTLEASEKLNARDVRSLIRAVTISPDGRRDNYMKLAADLGIHVCESTIRKYLRKAGFRRYITYPKPLVSWQNRRKRLK